MSPTCDLKGLQKKGPVKGTMGEQREQRERATRRWKIDATEERG